MTDGWIRNEHDENELKRRFADKLRPTLRRAEAAFWGDIVERFRETGHFDGDWAAEALRMGKIDGGAHIPEEAAEILAQFLDGSYKQPKKKPPRSIRRSNLLNLFRLDYERMISEGYQHNEAMSELKKDAREMLDVEPDSLRKLLWK